MHSFIAVSFILARVAFIAVGETVRHLGNLVCLATGQQGIQAECTAQQPTAVDITPDDTTIDEIAEILFPTRCAVYREPLARDPLTGALV